MKKAFLFSAFIFTICFHAYPDYEWGRIVTSENNTIACTIKVYDDGILLSDKKVIYKIGSQKFKIELKDVKVIFLGDRTYHVFPAYSYDEDQLPNIDESKFYRIGEVVVKGNVELLQAYAKSAMLGTAMPYGGYTPGPWIL